MTLFLPVGMPGSGKSYLGTEWFSSTEIVCPDDIREWLTDDVNDQTCNREVFKIVDRVVENRMKRGLDVYLDATNLNPKFWPDADFGQDRGFILMDTPVEVCYKRNHERDRTVPQHAMERMEKMFREFQNDPPINTVLSGDFRR